MTTNELLLVVGMAFVTFMIRYPMLVLVGRVSLPQPLIDGLRYVPVAVLTAICVPAVLLPQGQLWISPQNPYLAAGILTVLVAWRTGSLLLTIILGMGAFLAWRVLLGG
jgi:branched-subunit amino acid transport protein